MSKNISQIVNELFANPSEGKKLSSQIKLLGDEIRKVLHGEDTIFGKFQVLLASFKDVIPDENQRYQAALKALTTTSKLDHKEIMKAFKGQLEELKIVEKGILPSLSGWSDGLKEMEARAKELKGDIAELRKRLEKLESEETEVKTGIATREQDLKSAERTINDLFGDIAREITTVTRKVGELTGEAIAEELPAEKASSKKKKKKGEEESVEIRVDAAPMDPKYQKKCPMCGGLFNLHELENLWQCYTCGHEEPASGAGSDESGPGDGWSPGPESGPIFDPSQFQGKRSTTTADKDQGTAKGSERSADEPVQKKSCPGCGRTMFYYSSEKAWRCNSCGYERRI